MATATVDASALRDWQQVLSKALPGSPPACHTLLDEIGASLSDGRERLDLAAYVDLLERIGSQGRPSALAWSTGHAVALPFGPDVGRVILGCRSLGSALHWLARYFPLLQDASYLRLDVDGEHSTLSYRILDPSIWPRHEDAMYTLGTHAMMIKAAAPEAWNQCQVVVEAEPEQVRVELSSIVQTAVVYGASTNAIRFPSALLNAPLGLAPASNPATVKELTAELTRKMRAMSITERTRQMIFTEMNDGCVSQEHIARELGISSRTLRRRLAEEGQSFQALLDECRMQFAALEFRTRRQLSLSDMAFRLGYSEHSTFSRAFARWSGMAPQEYRRAVAPLTA